jgi:hypothetical protein
MLSLWHWMLSVTVVDFVMTLFDPQKLSLPNQLSKPWSDESPPKSSNDIDDEKAESIEDDDEKMSLSIEPTSMGSPKLKSRARFSLLRRCMRDMGMGLATTDEASASMDTERMD